MQDEMNEISLMIEKILFIVLLGVLVVIVIYGFIKYGMYSFSRIIILAAIVSVAEVLIGTQLLEEEDFFWRSIRGKIKTWAWYFLMAFTSFLIFGILFY